MRISDWSSDVCSSDLEAEQRQLIQIAAAAGMRIIGPNAQGVANFQNGMVANFSTMFTQLDPCDGPVAVVSQSGATGAAIYTDRKSDVEGQSVSVRVDIGGGRLIKTKKKETNKN